VCRLAAIVATDIDLVSDHPESFAILALSLEGGFALARIYSVYRFYRDPFDNVRSVSGWVLSEDS
jgi:hypothetical protein